MLVYGDAPRRETVSAKLTRVRFYLDEADRDGPWIVRHGFVVAALIEAGELAQGVADRASADTSGDDAPGEADAAMALVQALARYVGESWRNGAIRPEDASEAIERVGRDVAEGDLTIKLPEGFAHYALYPESYYEAALALAGRDLRVVGIRSIGTTLAGMVAAAVGASPVASVRPVGHPFARELSPSDAALFAVPPSDEIAIVDEGPGLSGSSVAAVADAAVSGGVEFPRIHVFPSHGHGPGPQASAPTRRFWQHARIHVRSFEETILQAENPARRLETWLADLIGEPIAPPREISGGGWRECLSGNSARSTPVHPWQERRKFLLDTADGTFLLRFAGLGRIGIGKLALAEKLAAAGFCLPPLGFRHGLLVERWHADARMPDPFGLDRPRLLRTLSAYLGFRAAHCPADARAGATAEQLLAMLVANLSEEFGPEAAEAADAWRPLLPRLEAGTRRIQTDNRLHAWEWLLLPDGSILKTDALDHHAGHDLVGCQDAAWDVAGATVEFALSEGEQRDVIAAVERASGLPIDPAHVRFATLCYLAFQLGYYREAGTAASDVAEAGRLEGCAQRYAGCLRALLGR